MMNDDYLWDRSGKPEPDIAKLEEQLADLKHRGSPPHFPEEEFEKLRRPRRWSWRFIFTWPRLAFAAAAIALITAALGYYEISSWRGSESGWDVTRLEGAPRIGAGTLRQTGRINVGESLVTDSSSRARIRVSDIGEVDIGPNSHVRLIQAGGSRKELALDRGILHARINAPPRQFYVDTPSAKAIDLGCEYDLTVDESGAGLIRVTLGWVQFEAGQRKVLIPAGALARTRPGTGPGTPYFEEVSPQFQSALEELDFGDGPAIVRSSALDLVLREVRRDDALTLFYLLLHLSPLERPPVYDRLAEILPPPRGVTRDAVLRLDLAQIAAWMDDWGLDHPEWN
jgi:hypothetical protein